MSSSGRPAPTGDVASGGLRWRSRFVEDFETDAGLGEIGSRYDGALRGYDGFADTSGRGRYDPDRVLTVHDSLLDYHLHTADGVPRVAAPTLMDWWGQTYGRYAIRFRADRVPGYKIAFLLWPSSDRWSDGEINLPEADLGGTVHGFSHDVTGDPARNAFAVDTGTTTVDWHTAVIEWAPDRVRFLLDDRAWSSTDPTAIPRRDMRWTLQAETAGAVTPVGAAGRVQVDWVAVWSLAGTA
ncbi:glycoside hydrolase family 16 protein [Nakamurella leprariae]|uniref:Glycoside hydrolase family 16 protein n=1 Tax=Nakamurella leprariae TaxID=2803911 RepID=A0A938YC95_9ACTN|nr:glycoside hydrolase family 16 protein [Nakamurella leprariae]MBM9467179.1 glycoside hydrolase family 16 protein [Nakamurella leprariae]